MTIPTAEINRLLDLLGMDMPELLATHPDEYDFSPAFAGRTDFILDGASEHDYAWVLSRIDEILIAHGKPPSGFLHPA